MAFELPPLPYEYSALEPHIDEQTMHLHHDKHHAAYVTNLNNALQGTAVRELLRRGRHPQPQRRARERPHRRPQQRRRPRQPHHVLGDHDARRQPAAHRRARRAITSTFGGLDQFKAAFNDAGAKRFGSGWAWLVLGGDGKLAVVSTPNQDSPLMDGQFPVFGNDVWEHAYYLKYQNRRAGLPRRLVERRSTGTRLPSATSRAVAANLVGL